jgi:uncharacterized SAM-binding protein YcdF (DUF218 family)
MLTTLWLHPLLAASIIVFGVTSRRRQLGPKIKSAAALLVMLCLVASVLTWPGLLLVQQSAAQFVKPAALLWIYILAVTVVLWHYEQQLAYRSTLVLFLLLTLLGNSTLASYAIRWLQGPYATVDPLQQGVFDAVLVLGGGTDTRQHGYTQISGSGDRVMLGARLYNLGLAKQLVASGRSSRRRPDPAEETRLIWTQLGIPDDAILDNDGRTTSEELRAFAELAEQNQWQRIGLTTSAWHLRRAMRQAARQQIAVTPLPADFKGRDPPWDNATLIPSEGGMDGMRLVIHEVVGMAVGR